MLSLFKKLFARPDDAIEYKVVEDPLQLPLHELSAISKYALDLVKKFGIAVLDPTRMLDEDLSIPALENRAFPKIIFYAETYNAEEALQNFHNYPCVKLPVHFIHYLAMSYSPEYAYAGVELTDFCNLTCTMCPFHGDKMKDGRIGRVKKILPFDTFKTFVDGLEPQQRLLLTATGEIFTLKEPFRYIEYAASKLKAHNIVVGTNGCFLSDDNIDRLLAIGLGSITVSVDGITAEVYNKIRKGSDLDTIVQNLRKLKDKRDRKGCSTQISINSICDDFSATAIKAYKDFWRGRADTLLLQNERLDVMGRGSQELITTNGRLPCFAPVSEGPVLMTDGKISPCCIVCTADWYYDLDWLLDATQVTPGQAFRYYSRMMLDPTSPLSRFCARCHFWKQSYASKAKGCSGFSQLINLVKQD